MNNDDAVSRSSLCGGLKGAVGAKLWTMYMLSDGRTISVHHRIKLLVRERSALATIVSRRVVMCFFLVIFHAVCLSVRSFFKMHFFQLFLPELDEILTQCSSVWCV